MIDDTKLDKPALLSRVRGLEKELRELRSAFTLASIRASVAEAEVDRLRLEVARAVRVLRAVVDREALRTAICLGCGQSDGHGERCEIEAVLGEGA